MKKGNPPMHALMCTNMLIFMWNTSRRLYKKLRAWCLWCGLLGAGRLGWENIFHCTFFRTLLLSHLNGLPIRNILSNLYSPHFWTVCSYGFIILQGGCWSFSYWLWRRLHRVRKLSIFLSDILQIFLPSLFLVFYFIYVFV